MRFRIPLLLLVSCAICAAAPVRAAGVHAVFSQNGMDVLAPGDGGQLLRSLDGGATWSITTLGSTALRGVAAHGLTIVIVGDSGKVWRSTDSGGSWSLAVLPGTPNLRSLSWCSASTLIAAGAGGAIRVSSNAGVSWNALSSGTTEDLNSIRFIGAFEGWAVGTHGTALHTTSGGASWTPVSVPTTQRLNAVDFRGPTVWLVGDRGVALKSVTGGVSWVAQNLRLDAGSEVRAVHMAGGDSVFIAGGGGFVRRSSDGGATWTFLRHTLMAPVSDLCLAGGRGWLASDQSRLISTTSDRGDTWTNPTGTLTFLSWQKLLGAFGTIRGATLALNPLDLKTLYTFRGRALYRSRDDGASWTAVDSLQGTTTTKVNAFAISPKDTNVMLAAAGTPDRLVRSIDGGHNWTTTLTMDFGEFGVPLEMDPDRPDTVLFGPDGGPLYRSLDFGQTWAPFSTQTFRSPCDIAIVPESDSSVVIVSDGITNSSSPAWIWRSTDGGLNSLPTFAPTTNIGYGSEVPELATSRLRNTWVYATSWSNGPAQLSSDRGLTWNTTLGSPQTWGVDVAKDDPDFVVVGQFGTGAGYLSFDGGTNFIGVPGLGGSNYSFYVRDRAFVLAEQSTGVYRLVVQDSVPIAASQSVTVTSPNGGESWPAGTVQDVTWNAAQVALARIDWRPSPADPWLPVATVAGYAGHYAWTVPNVATSTAEVRVSDAWDVAPADASDAPFSIATTVAVEDSPLQFALWPNQPNPFTQRTAIRYALPSRERVRLDVYDLQGHRVARLVDGEQGPGVFSVSFGADGAGAQHLAAGVYFCRIEAGAFRATRKMLLTR